MAFIFADRVKETSATTGTGTMTLAGAVTGFQAFGDALSNADECYYCITDGTDWEIGIGTYTTSGTTLSRDTILDSSNAGSAVNWTAATEVFLTHPAIYTANTVVNVGSSTDNRIARFDGTSGLVLQNSPVAIDDSGNMTGIGNLNGVTAPTAQFTTAKDTLLGNQSGVNTGDQDISGITANANAIAALATVASTGDYDDLSNKPDLGAANIISLIGPYLFPVGRVIEWTANDPGGSLGSGGLGFGTWERVEGRFIIGASDSDSDFDQGDTGGSKTQASNVTVATQPTFSVNSHSHPLSNAGGVPFALTSSTTDVTRNGPNPGIASSGNRQTSMSWGGGGNAITTSLGLVGDTDSATSTTTRTNDVALTNNATSVQQKYQVEYMWKRTA